MNSLEFRAMNTSVLLAGESHEAATRGMYAVKKYIEECETRFSRFLPHSELSELNASAGDWFKVSEDLMQLLNLCLFYYKETNGLFDPSILTDLMRIGYDRSMDEIRASGILSSHAPFRRPRPAFDEFEFDLMNRRVRLPHGLEVDLGGIAKGWIVEKAAHLLSEYSGSCVVNAGGDMFFIGQPFPALAWQVFLEDPRDPLQMLTALYIDSGAVATSSVAKRTWRQGDTERHHLIDPRTGESARTEWLSVTAIAPSLIKAEIYAKALLIGGNEMMPDFMIQHPEVAYLTVDMNGMIWGSPNSREYLYESPIPA